MHRLYSASKLNAALLASVLLCACSEVSQEQSAAGGEPPVIVSSPVLAATTQSAYRYQVEATDADAGEVLSFNLDTAPAGMTVDSSSGLVSWTPQPGQGGMANVSVRVTDSSDLHDEQAFVITVAVSVPNVVGAAQAEAAASLQAHNLALGAVDTATSLTVAEGDIVSQDPAAGETVAAGSLVAVLVSLGLPTVAVPNVAGMAQASAEAALAAAGLNVGSITTATSGSVAAGDVISQDPAARSVVVADTAVDLVVSLGTAARRVPALVGLTQTEAEAAIVDATFTVGAVTTQNHASIPADEVISQNPAAGSQAAAGTAVDIAVSLGPVLVAVPDVAGQTQTTAETAIAGAGLAVGTVSRANHPSVPAGSVISQDPAGGVQAAAGSAVDLQVSLGPAPNRDPAISSVAPTTATEGQPYAYPAVAQDPDGDALTYGLDLSPAGMTVDPDSGLVQWTPQTVQVGSHDIQLRVSDGRGGVAVQAFNITVDALLGMDSRPSNSTCLAGPAPSSNASIGVVQVFTNLSAFRFPVGLFQGPIDPSIPGHNPPWYLIEQEGRVYTFPNDPAVDDSQVTLLIDISSETAFSRDENGLLGLAFHPNFVSNNQLFLSWTSTVSGGLRSHVARFTLDGSTSPPREEILSVAQPAGNHNGGHMDFGPDGYLYIGLGDGGGQNDTFRNGQDTDTLLGAMLRIDVDGGIPYAIPGDNPFAGSVCGDGNPGCPEIYAWGFRNPWRWSFDRGTGELWLGDVGQNAWEEVDRVERGGNYGWRNWEGTHCILGPCGDPFDQPVLDYSHSLGVSVTGGYVYRGTAIPELQGRYLFGDFASGRIWGVQHDSNGAALPINELELLQTNLSISSFGQDHDGEVYVVDYGLFDTGIHKIVPGGSGGSSGGPPLLLSDTGCVDPNSPSQPASGMIPYAINAPFWSDGAVKERWMALPDGTTIDIDGADDWQFPIGSVLMKHFRLGGALIETRLFMRHDNGDWAGYSYAWNAAGSDAARVDGGRTQTIDGQDWRYPSSSECLNCHTQVAGRVLGAETAQLNRPFDYPAPGRTANQLSTLEAIGMFTLPLGGSPDDHPRLSDPADASAGLEDRVRAYFHANCAQCHQPSGPAPVNIDLHYTTAIADMLICDVVPTAGGLGLTDPRIVAPGAADRSVVLERMRLRDVNAMPPLGSNLVDIAGSALVEQWINGLAGCP